VLLLDPAVLRAIVVGGAQAGADAGLPGPQRPAAQAGQALVVGGAGGLEVAGVTDVQAAGEGEAGVGDAAAGGAAAGLIAGGHAVALLGVGRVARADEAAGAVAVLVADGPPEGLR